MTLLYRPGRPRTRPDTPENEALRAYHRDYYRDTRKLGLKRGKQRGPDGCFFSAIGDSPKTHSASDDVRTLSRPVDVARGANVK